MKIFLVLLFLVPVGFIPLSHADTVETNHPTYSQGDWIRISGQWSGIADGQFMTLQIINPKKSDILVVDQFLPNKDGSFAVNYVASGDKWNAEGLYHLKVSYGGRILEKTFEFSFESQEILISPCLDDEVLVKKVRNSEPFCFKEYSAKRWEEMGIISIVETFDSLPREQSGEKLLLESGKAESIKRKLYGEFYDSDPETLRKYQEAKFLPNIWNTTTNTISIIPTSTNDLNQLIMILPPNQKSYRGHITYSGSSNNFQLVALHGPVEDPDLQDRPYWSPDGQSKYAMTVIKPEKNMGTWKFTSNALAIKPTKLGPLTISHSLSFMVIEPSQVLSDTINSKPETVKGHESHSVAFILPPNKDVLRGHLTYSASDKVQVMVLHGPLPEDKIKNQPTWTIDGNNIYGITLIDNEQSSGSFLFSGNAIAIHSYKEKPFSLTYSLVLNPTYQ